MLPSEYVSEIVRPTVDEYLAATGDLRRAILACVVTYHVRDYLAEAGICSRTAANPPAPTGIGSTHDNGHDIENRSLTRYLQGEFHVFRHRPDIPWVTLFFLAI